ncbi:LuxR C-terminal-related transcriptional regulator [Burkholderia cepacia]|nr:LuxR C-terminal-related transcriptional regulator [Burkholderia cepacia]
MRRRSRTTSLLAKIAALGPRERDVLRLIGAGLASKEIARLLDVSPRTVSKHRENIMHKLSIHELARLMRIGREL